MAMVWFPLTVQAALSFALTASRWRDVAVAVV
jgi:hypothetical protein